MAHYLEAWSDVRSLDGTAALVQPLVEPLYEGKSPHELLSVLLDETPRKGYDVVKESWKAARAGRGGLRGVLEEEPSRRRRSRHGPRRRRRSRCASPRSRRRSRRRRRPPKASDLEVVFRPDPSLLDGRFANNGWLQELPEAAQQADVGQRRDRLPRHGAEARPAERGRREGRRRTGRASSCPSSSSRARRRASSRSTSASAATHAGPRRQRRRRRRHAAPHDRRALDRRRASRSRRRAPAPRSRTRSSTSGWRGARSSG